MRRASYNKLITLLSLLSNNAYKQIRSLPFDPRCSILYEPVASR